MKLTIEKLRQLIKEEIDKLNESTIQQKLASYREIPVQASYKNESGSLLNFKEGFKFITDDEMYLKQMIDEMIREGLLELDGKFSIENKELFFKPTNHGKYKDFKDFRQTAKNLFDSLNNAGLKVKHKGPEDT